MDRKVVSDDALISTDIDSLIRAIAARKKIEMGALARELGMKLSILKKWVAILEEEGYVRIEYHLLNEYVLWAGGELRSPVKSEEPPKEPIMPAPVKAFEPPKEFNSEERIERIFERLEKAGDKTDDITKSVLSSFSKNEPKLAVEEKPVQKEEVPIINPESEQKKAKEENERAEFEKKHHEQKAVADMKKKLSSHMQEIKAQKEDIESLKAQKGKLLFDAYAPIEKRFANAYDSIASKLLEKEGKIIELKEKMVELPPKVDALDDMRSSLEKVVKNARGVLEESKDDALELKEQISKQDKSLQEQMGILEKAAKSKKDEMNDLEDRLNKLEDSEKSARKSIDDLNKQISEITRAMLSANSTLGEIAQERSKIVMGLETLKSSIDSDSAAMEQTYLNFNQVRQAQDALRNYLDDYGSKVDELEQYVKEGEKDLVRLREFAEMKYMRHYMGELSEISSKYETELHEVANKEKEIDSKIATAKEKLDALLTESRDLIKAIELKTSGLDYDGLLQVVRDRQAKTADILNEKSAQSDAIAKERKVPSVLRQKSLPKKKGKKKKGRK